jgi:DNA-directed RNA polymerase subunit RPC12/RpoP
LALVREGTPAQTHAVTCPHCKKEFEGELIAGSAPRYTGFKCPHCKLFVPYERTEADET